MCKRDRNINFKSRVAFFFFFLVFSTSLSLVGNSGRLTWVRHSSRKSSASHSYQCVEYLRVSKQRYGCQCLRFLTCAQIFLHAITHGGCTDTVRESPLEAESMKKRKEKVKKKERKKNSPQRGFEPASVLRLVFQ